MPGDAENIFKHFFLMLGVYYHFFTWYNIIKPNCR